MNLAKTSIYSVFSTGSKILSLLIINKVFATQLGPESYVNIGNFQNFAQLLLLMSGANFAVGVTKLTSEFKTQPQVLSKIWQSALNLGIVLNLVWILISVIFFNQVINLFKINYNIDSVFITLLIFSFFSFSNSLLMAIANGQKDIKTFSYSNIVGNGLMVVATVYLTFTFREKGALIAIAIMNAIILIPSLFFSLRTKYLNLTLLVNLRERSYFKPLLKFGVMGTVAAVCTILINFLIRNLLVEKISKFDAGLWEGVWRVSTAYLMVITTIFSVYYLPTLAEQRSKKDLRITILQFAKKILPLVFLTGLTIYFLRHVIIAVLFSKDFIMMEELFLFQILGDFLKICGWLLAFVMWAKGMGRTFVITEILISCVYYFLTVALIDNMGAKAVVVSYSISYLAYLVLMYQIICKKYLCSDMQ